MSDIQKLDTTTAIEKSIMDKIGRGEIQLPADYSPENALKQAWLTLQETVTKDNKPVLQVCTKTSIANSLLDMVVQGLNPGKKQCYFIAYGQKLICQRSYMGAMAVLKRIHPGAEIVAQTVYQGDKLEIGIEDGRRIVRSHTQSLESLAAGKVAGAYCIIRFPDPRGVDYSKRDLPVLPPKEHVEIMSIEQIRKSWAKSRVYDGKAETFHVQFPDRAAERTVINRACWRLINESNDRYLIEAYRRSSVEEVEEEIQQEMLAGEQPTVEIEADDWLPPMERFLERCKSEGFNPPTALALLAEDNTCSIASLTDEDFEAVLSDWDRFRRDLERVKVPENHVREIARLPRD